MNEIMLKCWTLQFSLHTAYKLTHTTREMHGTEEYLNIVVTRREINANAWSGLAGVYQG